MSTHTVVAAKTALLDHLRALPGLQGVQIAYGYPARDLEQEVIYGGAGRYSRTINALAGGMGGLSYEVAVTVDLHIQVRIPGGEVEQAEARAIELGAEVEEFLGANSRMSELPGLLYSSVTGGELGYVMDDDAVTSGLQLTVEFTSYPV